MLNFLKHYVIHKWFVFWYMLDFCGWVMWRAVTHDLSKLSKAEMSSFIALSRNDQLKDQKYGSPEYKKEIEKYRGVIDVHYKNNRHHPQHFEFGVGQMTIVDIIEMVCDWEAAGKRTKGGNLKDSIEHNADRFNIPSLFVDMVRRTFLNREGY